MTPRSTQPQQPSQPVVYITQNPVVTDSIGQAAQQRSAIIYRLGIIQVCLSGVILVLGIISLVYNISYRLWLDGFFTTGVWTPCFFFTSGLLGILSRKRKNRSLVDADLIFAIFSALAASTLVIFEVINAFNYSLYGFYDYTSQKVSFGIHICLAILGMAEFVIAIVHAAYCCNCTCCGSSQPCCMPSNETNSIAVTYTYTNALKEMIKIQPVNSNYNQVAPGQPVANPQFIQKPFIMTSGAPHQQVGHQIPHTVQTSTEISPI